MAARGKPVRVPTSLTAQTAVRSMSVVAALTGLGVSLLTM
jgi:hypothetical protein